MSVTQEQIDAYATMMDSAGAIQTMTVGGQTFTFRPLPEMRARLAEMRRELAVAAAGGGSRTRYVATSKGVD